jgi:16S rRNA (guanine527-N7)-methyltransferase
MDEEKIVREWLNDKHLSLSDNRVSSLLIHVDMVREYSSKLNLISKADLAHIIERHLLDSLAALKEYDIPNGAKLADAGSGAGFPGIPIAIARRDIQMHLIESRRRKSLFLAKVVDKLGLTNTKVINDRWENLNYTYDVVLARAFAGEDEIETLIMPRLTAGGVVLYFAKYNQIKVLKK